MAKEIKMQGQYQPADATANNDERMRDAVQLKKQMVALMTTSERVEFIEYFNDIATTMSKLAGLLEISKEITSDEYAHILYVQQYFTGMANAIAGDEGAQE